MPRETIGYARLEWTCPNCGTRNPGPQKICQSCGAAQPQDVQFEQAAEGKLIEDQAELTRAKAGPDIHCPYCGARNPAGAKACSQCGGSLDGAAARSSGRIVGTYDSQPAQPVPCPACGTPNPATALHCSKCGAPIARPQPQAVPSQPPAHQGGVRLLIGALGLLALFACALVFLVLPQLQPAKELTGKVQALSWARTIAIEQLSPVQREAWRDEIPAGAQIGNCSRRLHHTQDEPAAGAEKVCGTPYSVDKGNGYAEVVQDCQYQVYADWCEYTAQEWREVDTAKSAGNGPQPQWPTLSLGPGQREGERHEDYQVIFNVDGEQYTYHAQDVADYARFQVGSRWALKARGSTVVSLQPAP